MIYPTYLTAGDTIGIVAPARKVNREELEFAIRWWEKKGFRIVLGKHLFAEDHQYAGTDAMRIEDFQNMLNNSDIKAIFCARGGYGTLRVIDQLEFLGFSLEPKWICGFSDITVLHSHINKICRVATIHSTMPISTNGNSLINLETLFQILIGEQPVYECKPHALNRIGECTGELVGGNLSLLYALSGSISDIDTTNKILFIEDVDEYLYHIDRMMLQLKRSGKFKKLAGLLVGNFTKMRDNDIAFGSTFEQIIREHCEEYNFPIAFNFPAGHDEINVAMKFGTPYHLMVESTKTTLKSK
ncbi:MAG: LD-carboxypeptidase [Bacteroidetes bacterium]|nr:LD-carboxypeptidase [Bacteroidota bacterium]MCL2301842.1 LD-carboxypeptidase [Lentimicrobiaceae bacterium]